MDLCLIFMHLFFNHTCLQARIVGITLHDQHLVCAYILFYAQFLGTVFSPSVLLGGREEVLQDPSSLSPINHLTEWKSFLKPLKFCGTFLAIA